MTKAFDTDEIWVTDEELTALALAADPDAPLAHDAVPLSSLLVEYPELRSPRGERCRPLRHIGTSRDPVLTT